MSAPPPQSPSSGAGAPSTLGGFRLLEVIGRGGMGEVWRAEREGPGGYRRRAALKRILPRFQADPTLRARFLAEAKINARLEHPNITQVLDYGESPEPYLALEYIEGTTVARVLKVCAESQQRIPPAAAAYLIAEVATGLDYAHRRKDESGNPLLIVHRDVSPQNVLISNEGAVKISDFGIARAADNQLRTQQGIAVGKLAYMAPEQASGGLVDWRADVFALGVLLWETLLVRPLIPRNDSNAAIQLLLSGRFEPPSRLDPRLPPQLDAAVMEALQVDPNRRTQSAGILAQQLRGYLHSVAPGFDGAALVRVVAPLAPEVQWQVQPAAPTDAHPPIDAGGGEPATRLMSEAAVRAGRPATMAPPTRGAPAAGIAPQMASPQMASPQMASPQMASPQMASPQMGPPQMGPSQMGPPQMGSPYGSPPNAQLAGFGQMPPSVQSSMLSSLPPSPPPVVAPSPVSPVANGPRAPMSMRWITLGIAALMVCGAGALFLYLTRSPSSPRGSLGDGPVVTVGTADAGDVAGRRPDAPRVEADAGAPAAVDLRARADAALIALDPRVRVCIAAERAPPEWVDLVAVFDNVWGSVSQANVTFRGARGATDRLRGCVIAVARSARFVTVPGSAGTTQVARSWPGRTVRPGAAPSGGTGFDFPFGRAR